MYKVEIGWFESFKRDFEVLRGPANRTLEAQNGPSAKKDLVEIVDFRDFEHFLTILAGTSLR